MKVNPGYGLVFMTVSDNTTDDRQENAGPERQGQSPERELDELLNEHAVHALDHDQNEEFGVGDGAAYPSAYRWERRARQIQFWFRITGAAFLLYFLIGWPLGTSLAELEQTGIFRFRMGYSLPVFLYMSTVPILIFIVGHVLSLGLRMAGKAEELEMSATRLIRPEESAAENIQTVGKAVRGHIASLNTHIDEALSKLASVESMIRQQVKAIDTAAETMQSNSEGNIQKISQERQQLIELTEHLNEEAGKFAEAIAEKAKLGLENSETANTRIAGAERELENRLIRLEETAQKALGAFERLSTTLQENEESVYQSSARLETLSTEANQKTSYVTRLIDENATTISQAQQRLLAESERLENLILDQRERTGRLAETIAQQTEDNPEVRAALEKLNGIETMIREQVQTLGQAASTMQTVSGDNAERLASEQQNLIELAEHLNLEAEKFASAIGEKARLGLEATEEANNRLSAAEADLDNRLQRLEAASEQALGKFEQLANAITEKETAVAETTGRLGLIQSEAGQKISDISKYFDQSAGDIAEAQQRLAEESQRLESLIHDQRERSEHLAEVISQQGNQDLSLDETLSKLASVEHMIRQQIDAIDSASSAMQAASGDSAQRLAGERQQLIDLTVSLNREAENLAEVITDKAKLGTAHTDEANIRIDGVERELDERLSRLEEKADRALTAFSKVSETLSEKEASVSEAGERLALMNTETNQKTSDMARMMEQNANAITAAQERLAAESQRLEELIEEQRVRADKLAEAIAQQTEQLGALSARPVTKPEPSPSSLSSTLKPLSFSRIEPVTDPGSDTSFAGTAVKEPLEHLKVKQQPGGRQTPREARFEKSWRDILAAADQPEEPLTLGGMQSSDTASNSASENSPPVPSGDSNVIDLVRSMQHFMMDLEQDLYGKPQQAIISRFENGERNIFANIILRRDEESVKNRIRLETSRNETFRKSVYEFLENFDRLLEPATGEQDGDNLIDDYLGSPIGQVYLIVGSAMDYFS